MSAQGLINHYSRAFIRGALAQGHSVAEVCGRAGIAPGSLREANAFDPEKLAVISRAVQVLMDDEFYGLTARRCKVGAFSLVCDLMVATDTLADALKKAFHGYSIFTEEIRFELSVEAHTASVRVCGARPGADVDHVLCEWWLLKWRAISSWLIGEEIPFLQVTFPHAPAVSAEHYTTVFSRNCRFSQPLASFSFDRRYLGKRIVRNNADLGRFLASRCFDLMTIPDVAHSLKTEIKNYLESGFARTRTFPSMEAVAERYYMCTQTLRRHLDEEGTSYREIKEEIRRGVVMKWLSNIDVPIVEVAHIGGFAEPNGLTRALKSWTGLSPTSFRKKLLANRAGERRAEFAREQAPRAAEGRLLKYRAKTNPCGLSEW